MSETKFQNRILGVEYEGKTPEEKLELCNRKRYQGALCERRLRLVDLMGLLSSEEYLQARAMIFAAAQLNSEVEDAFILLRGASPGDGLDFGKEPTRLMIQTVFASAPALRDKLLSFGYTMESDASQTLGREATIDDVRAHS